MACRPAAKARCPAGWSRATLEVPLLALDTVKEALFAELGTGDRLHNRRFGRASYGAIWALVGEFPAAVDAVVVDAWFGFQPLELLQGHLERRRRCRASVEVWCHGADLELIAQPIRRARAPAA